MIPAGYERCSADHATALVVSAAASWLDGVFGQGLTLHDWARGVGGAETLSGRGTVYAVDAPVPGPDRRRRWAVRHYCRGGHVVRVLGDRYVAPRRPRLTRPEAELRASAAARARGVPTPAVIAGAWYPSGLFYRADLVTELVPGAKSLAAVLFATARDERATEALTAAARLVRELGHHGVRHTDLNAMNIILTSDGSVPTPHVIDLDRAGISDAPGPALARSMRNRLERSLRKLGASSGRPLSRAEWSAFHAAFGEAA